MYEGIKFSWAKKKVPTINRKGVCINKPREICNYESTLEIYGGLLLFVPTSPVITHTHTHTYPCAQP